jgi:hypothetical protein
MNQDGLAPVLDQLAPGATVHSGFLGQFRAVTDQADNSSYDIKCVLNSPCSPTHFALLGGMTCII